MTTPPGTGPFGTAPASITSRRGASWGTGASHWLSEASRARSAASQKPGSVQGWLARCRFAESMYPCEPVYQSPEYQEPIEPQMSPAA